MTIRVALAGHRGKTGSALEPALAAAPDVEYVGGLGRFDDVDTFLRDHRPQALVDFTHPSIALDNALAAAAAGAAPIVGTSGLAAEAVDRLEAACAAAGVGGIVAPNFAIGAVVMMHLADAKEQTELRLKQGSDGKIYLGPEGPAPESTDREVVTFDGRLLIMRWVDPDNSTRYGTSVYVRCGAPGTASAKRKTSTSSVPAQ